MKKVFTLVLVLCVFCASASAEIFNIHWCTFFAFSDWVVITEDNKGFWDAETQKIFDNLYVEALAFFEDPTYGFLEIRVDLTHNRSAEDLIFSDLDDNYLFFCMYQVYKDFPEKQIDLSRAKVQTIGNNKWFVLPGSGDSKASVVYQTCYKGQTLTITALYRGVDDIQPLTPLTELFIKYVDFTNKTEAPTNSVTY